MKKNLSARVTVIAFMVLAERQFLGGSYRTETAFINT